MLRINSFLSCSHYHYNLTFTIHCEGLNLGIIFKQFPNLAQVYIHVSCVEITVIAHICFSAWDLPICFLGISYPQVTITPKIVCKTLVSNLGEILLHNYCVRFVGVMCSPDSLLGCWMRLLDHLSAVCCCSSCFFLILPSPPKNFF